MSKEVKDFFREMITIIVIAFILAMILRTFVIEGRIIPSGSMLPTLQLQDRVMVNKFIYHFKEPQRGDIVVFAPPEVLNSKDDYIKRVIGLPGDTVEMKNNQVYINNKPLKEPYLAEPLNYEYGPVVVPDNCLLVLGDNRNHSFDSHMWNAWLTKDRIKGKAFVIYWPVKEIKLLDRGGLDENTVNQ
ncbi:Peptidase S26A, signal peptidase I [Syntrophomonas zehnderi OL-4]|uniref:Signal peptidase I n=1 Tax=Syntrophomonas zehnderi OL-4 TaxID=690567 RepID=A0A0E4G8Q3_9FIRM|nr:signal peptidase I [Syntrophomonas zehnderi]CFW97132.1 Peptidase S26A, signal peptidase I [Syntrophomonas zehnderi OL-4]